MLKIKWSFYGYQLIREDYSLYFQRFYEKKFLFYFIFLKVLKKFVKEKIKLFSLQKFLKKITLFINKWNLKNFMKNAIIYINIYLFLKRENKNRKKQRNREGEKGRVWSYCPGSAFLSLCNMASGSRRCIVLFLFYFILSILSVVFYWFCLFSLFALHSHLNQSFGRYWLLRIGAAWVPIGCSMITKIEIIMG